MFHSAHKRLSVFPFSSEPTNYFSYTFPSFMFIAWTFLSSSGLTSVSLVFLMYNHLYFIIPNLNAFQRVLLFILSNTSFFTFSIAFLTFFHYLLISLVAGYRLFSSNKYILKTLPLGHFLLFASVSSVASITIGLRLSKISIYYLIRNE